MNGDNIQVFLQWILQPIFTTIEVEFLVQQTLNHSTKATYNTFESDTEKSSRSPMIITSLFTHQVLETASIDRKNISRYDYDHQEKLMQADSAVSTLFAVNKCFQYTLSPQLNQVMITAANGKTKPGQLQRISSVTYDTYGRVAKEYAYRKNPNTNNNI